VSELIELVQEQWQGNRLPIQLFGLMCLNLAISNPELILRIQETIDQLQDAGIEPTADLVYASGSGLDPHISIEAARRQIERIAIARSLETNQVETLIRHYTDGRFLGIFGEPGVNVLRLLLKSRN
jgi:potassium-transporting ATPase KdpC subunit